MEERDPGGAEEPFPGLVEKALVGVTWKNLTEV